jgi:hypothetical protein
VTDAGEPRRRESRSSSSSGSRVYQRVHDMPEIESDPFNF